MLKRRRTRSAKRRTERAVMRESTAILLTALLIGAAPSSASPSPAPRVDALFAIYDDGALEPVAVRSGDHFLPADGTSGESPSAFVDAANAALGAHSREVHVIFGRRTVATVTADVVRGTASIRIPGALHLGGNVNALASPTLTGSATHARRAPTAAERRAALAAAAAALHTSTARLTVANLTAIDLGAATPSLVGTVGVTGSGTPRRDTHAFFVYEPPAGLTLFNAQTIGVTEPLLADVAEYLVDAVDVPGAGPALVTRSLGYDAHTYVIYARSGARWRKIYTGGGVAL